MEAIEIFGPRLSAMIIVIAVVYFIVSFVPVWFPAIRVFRHKARLPRPFLFVGVVSALVYGVFSFLVFVILLPLEAYSIFIAPQLEAAGMEAGGGIRRALDFLISYWWIFVPLVQLVLTWYITSQVGKRWMYICAVPPNESTFCTHLKTDRYGVK